METQKVKALVSVDTAQELIQNAIETLPPERIKLVDCTGRVLARDIPATISLPPFDQSAMDGYAVRFEDVNEGGLHIAGIAAAGKSTGISLEKNKAIRIFTGAMIPKGTDTVVKQEDTSVEDGYVYISAETVTEGQNIRKQGAQIASGDIALRKGIKLNPGSIGYLAALGISEAEVARLPKVAVVVTGNELKQAGEILEPGEIYESNSIALIAGLKRCGISPVSVHYAIDDPEVIRAAIGAALDESDVVLITGGVSVGDLDHTSKVLSQLGVKKIFHGVTQRPGKPLFFGKRNSTLVFGLPGNPASVLSCFYVYVARAIDALQGNADRDSLRTVILPLAEKFTKHADLTYFLKGKMQGNNARILPGQDSFILSSFSEADCLIVAPFGVSEIQAGTPVHCYILP